MIKKLFTYVVLVGMCCTVALAQTPEKKVGPSITEWLKGLQLKIAQIIPKKSVSQETVVAGVRGAKENASTTLYWKGKKGEEPVTEEELAEFKKGIDLAAAGQRAEALKMLQEFMKQYPDSALIPDAKKTVDLVKSEGK
jgi:TolA-binding protein